MSLFILKHPNAVLPTRSTKRSAGYDLTAVSVTWDDAKTKITVDTGVALGDVPEGFFAALFPKSSVVNTDCRLANGVGVVDADYPDTIKLVFDVPLVASMVVSPGNSRVYKPGDQVGQVVFLPCLVDDEFPVTAERDGGFGSTAKKGKKV